MTILIQRKATNFSCDNCLFFADKIQKVIAWSSHLCYVFHGKGWFYLSMCIHTSRVVLTDVSAVWNSNYKGESAPQIFLQLFKIRSANPRRTCYSRLKTIIGLLLHKEDYFGPKKCSSFFNQRLEVAVHKCPVKKLFWKTQQNSR